jgi:hypothetical protein
MPKKQKLGIRLNRITNTKPTCCNAQSLKPPISLLSLLSRYKTGKRVPSPGKWSEANLQNRQAGFAVWRTIRCNCFHSLCNWVVARESLTGGSHLTPIQGSKHLGEIILLHTCLQKQLPNSVSYYYYHTQFHLPIKTIEACSYIDKLPFFSRR